MSLLRSLIKIKRVLHSRFPYGYKALKIPWATMASTADQIYGILDSTFVVQDTGVHIQEAKCKSFISFYRNLTVQGDRSLFLRLMAERYGINHDYVMQLSRNLPAAQDRSEAMLLKTEERLRGALMPRYQQLFGQIGKVDSGVKFLVDMRVDVLNSMSTCTNEVDMAYYQALNLSLKELLVLWFSVGLLNLQRVTWESPCDMVQKITDYEAVHPVKSWTDVKRRVGPYRRCYVFTHNSMPREPVVVLHTALTDNISSSIHSIIQSPGFRGSSNPEESSPEVLDPPTEQEVEDPSKISTAVFYSITSTQKGLQSVDLGNYLIKRVVRELQVEYPQIDKYSSMSPIPGFRVWLIGEINKALHISDIGEVIEDNLLTRSELLQLQPHGKNRNALETFKHCIQSHQWLNSPDLLDIIKAPLMRLCAQYLYVEKRRGYALNPVATFHLKNGAVMWRLNWLADASMRGLTQSCGMMINYRYFLDTTDENSQKYLENHTIAASQQIIDLASGVTPQD
ncbi:malonyl-CoA decarboxylase, mitochondrial-like isoform X1 [Haliotis rufescens]|uniref:malonyl-CoA decarboxylase, mitochondrial-like isoform X1 n=3 Tax=Haliotis rufescens TaxID=6454 RepID=UPI001EB05A70|nr:malonyl-CoA decarboxylase, mitochondrial-like isoform X1 [Haliotis rufescens]